ncbi:MAG TPA: YggT family protein [Candidatus Saccharibacteria bacterium]|nr:YggT family protein [Candidatus Saccharibacteria bacterium]HRQ06955.1 YggT family protein [Candidatus Saccharibacteria bacterium]
MKLLSTKLDKELRRNGMRYVLTKVIYGVFGLAELFLGLRFILKLFGANAGNDFVNWVYETSGAVLDPFRGIFPTEVFKGSFVIEFSTLFAIIVYAIIAMLLVYIIELITHPVVTKKK